jgi:hypothetical protein
VPHYFLAHPQALNGSGLEAGVGHDNGFRLDTRKRKDLIEVAWPGLSPGLLHAAPWPRAGTKAFTQALFDVSPEAGSEDGHAGRCRGKDLDSGVNANPAGHMIGEIALAA